MYVLGDAVKGLDGSKANGIDRFFYRNDIPDPESIFDYLINDFDDETKRRFGLNTKTM